MKHFGEIAFTPAVKAQQEKQGSRAGYENFLEGPAPRGFTEPEIAMIQSRDSFYMASVSETGWPYMQHRGGPAGFLKVLSENEIGFADYRGNRQYVSIGNVSMDDRVALFLMDYPNRTRLKMLGHAEVRELEGNEDLAERLFQEGQGKVERYIHITIDAFDWNCPKYITERYTLEDVKRHMVPITEQLQALEKENAFLKEELAKALSGRTRPDEDRG